MIKSKVVIVFPKRDQAASSMWNIIEESSLFKRLDSEQEIYAYNRRPNDIKAIHVDNDGVNISNLEEIINTDLFIFASRHSAESGFPALLIHTPGNWGEARLGGNSNELAYSSALAIKIGLKNLRFFKDDLKLEEYRVGIEVTHHGPTNMSTPLCFMELGSSEKYWTDKRGAEGVAKAIIKTAEEYLKAKSRENGESVYVGFGGNHYAYRFEKKLYSEESILIGHIAPKYVLDHINYEIVKQAFEKTIENPFAAMVDKKGTRSEHRKKIREFIDKLGKEYLEV